MVQMPDYVAPAYELEAFHCPFCGAYAHMIWTTLQDEELKYDLEIPFTSAGCQRCGKHSIWEEGDEGEGQLLYPPFGAAPPAHPKMPAGTKADYEEAAKVAGASPRAAAALLRLAVERLCAELKASGRNLNEQIGDLVRRGLPESVAQALDVLRVIGNNSVHPGEMSSDDVGAVASKLFRCLNLIVEHLISIPADMKELSEGLPNGAKSAIQKRDGKKAG